MPPPLLHWLQHGYQCIRRPTLALDAANAGAPTSSVYLLQCISTAENFVHISDRAHVGIARVRASNAGWIGDHGLELLPNQRLGIRHVLPIETAADLAKVAFKDANGTVRTLGDVSTVVEDHQPLIGDAIVDGNPGLVLVVEKFPMGDTQEITREVDKALAALEPGLPGVTIDKDVFRSDSFLAVATDNLSRVALVSRLVGACSELRVIRFASSADFSA